MKVVAPCFKCNEEFGIISLFLENHNNEICEFTCDNGHKNYVIIQNENYDLLYESGIIALLDGYYRECVMNISSSLECFYEYVILLLIFSNNGNDYKNAIKFYKRISKRSECREGAFYGLCRAYLKDDLFINDKTKKVRNDVIHNGIYPTYDESFVFSKEICQFINNCYNKIINTIDSNTFKKYNDFRFINKAEKYFDKKNTSTCLIPTVLNDYNNNKDFDKSVDICKSNNKIIFK